MTSAMGPRFVKGHGARNDFVLIQDPGGEVTLDAPRVARIAERTAGIGADGVIRVVRTRAAGVEAPADAPEWFMDYRNADGSVAEMCGNGVRVFAAHLVREGLVDADAFSVWTRAGERTVEILRRGPVPGAPGHGEADGRGPGASTSGPRWHDPAAPAAPWQIRVGMGKAEPGPVRRALHLTDRTLETVDVSLGNPHCVAFLPAEVSVADLDLSVRPVLDPEPEGGTNLELVQEVGTRHVAVRVLERGVGETLACGTGACAVAVAAAERVGDHSGEPWRIDLPGGTLTVGWDDAGDVTLSGPAQIVAEGELLI